MDRGRSCAGRIDRPDHGGRFVLYQANMDNSILSELQWDADGGALIFKGVRYLLIRPETLVQFQKAVEAEVGAEYAGELLYAGGFTGGQLSGKRYQEAFGFTERQAVEFMCRMGGEIGWGRFEVKRLEIVDWRLEVEVHNSVFARAYRNQQSAISDQQSAVCHLIRGVLGGLVAGLSDGQVRARETQCLAQGDAHCRFEVEGIA